MSLKPIPKGTAVVRTSKYRHLFGQLLQNSEWVNSVTIGQCQTESNVLKANEKFYAWPWSTSGTVAVVPTSFKGALNGADQPLIVHDDTTINDLAWHPFNQNLLATALQNGEVNLWSIPDEGLTSHLTKPTVVIPTGEKRLLSVDFHPVADNVLIAFDAGKQVRFFDLETASEKFALPDVHKALPTNISWNLDGSLCATSCKDKTLRIFDPRANSVSDSVEDHQGVKGGRVTWLRKKNLIFTNGFGKGSDRQIALYDPRKLSQKLTLQVIDTSNSSLLPFYEEDNGIMLLAGKGDGNIRFYEIVNEEPYIYFLSEFKAKDPQSGVSLLPRANDPTKNEIMRLAKLTPNGHIMPIKFEVPRQDVHHFQEDLFPDTFDNKPALSSAQWFGGETKQPVMRSQKP